MSLTTVPSEVKGKRCNKYRVSLTSSNRRPVSSVGRAPEVAGSNLDRTNTQGLKITEEKVLPL